MSSVAHEPNRAYTPRAFVQIIKLLRFLSVIGYPALHKAGHPVSGKVIDASPILMLNIKIKGTYCLHLIL